MPAPVTAISRPVVPLLNDPAFDTLAQAAKDTFGYRHFTVLAWISSRGALRRVWTADPEDYPTGGEKIMPSDSCWVGTVITDQKPHCCWNEEDIRNTYSDWQILVAKGISSLICVPVIYDGKTVGSLNFSGGSDYNQDTLSAIMCLADSARVALSAYSL